MPHSPKGSRDELLGGEFMETKPLRVEGLDLRGFKFDPLSAAILEYVDRGFNVGQMVEKLDESASAIIETLNVLRDGGVIKWRAVQVNVPKHTLAPPPIIEIEKEKSRTELHQGLDSIGPAPPAGEKSGAYGGTLDQKNVQLLVADSNSSSFTGSISLERNGDQVVFYFEEGRPMGVSSRAPRHDYGTMLKKVELFDDAKLNAYRSAVAANYEPIHALRVAGIRDRATMEKIVTWRGRELYREVQAWTDGNYLCTPGAGIPPGVMRCNLKLVNVVKVDWRKEHLTAEQNQFISDNELLYLVATDRAREITARMKLSTKESRYVEHLIEGSPMQLREALTISTLFKAMTRKLIYVLIERGALEFHKINHDSESPISLGELETYCRNLEAENHYNVLSAHAVSTEDEIKIRYERMLGKLNPKYFENANEQQLRTLEKIRGRVKRAWEVLGDEKSRRAYRKTVYSEYQLKIFLKTQLEKANTALNMHSNPKEALELAVSAWDLMPGNPSAGNLIAVSLRALGRQSEIGKYGIRS